MTTMRMSYLSSEVAGQLIFCVVSFYLLKFYTDVFGLSAATAGGILLVARMVDALDAPLWGVLFDKTHSRWGRSRPWFLWLCVPFALLGVLTFHTPALPLRGKITYAAVTYVLCSVLYTGINTPVTSILSALTPDPRERVTLTSFRMFGSKLGVLLVNLTLLPLVTLLGQGSAQRGFSRVMPLYACGTVALYLLAFRNLREQVSTRLEPLSLRQSFAALRGNVPWLLIASSSFCFWIAFVGRITCAPYYFEYVLHRPRLISLANSMDVVSLVGILFLPRLCRLTSRAKVWAARLAASVVTQLVLCLAVGHSAVTVAFAGWTLGFLASGIAMAMPFSLLAESVDFGEWRSGVRAAGMLTAIGAAFCLKAGSGLGGALPAWILGAYHYVPNVPQTAHAMEGIRLGFIWLPAVFYLLALLPVLRYGHYEQMEPKIRAELEARRSCLTVQAQGGDDVSRR